jgi:hypothetical protein
MIHYGLHVEEKKHKPIRYEESKEPEQADPDQSMGSNPKSDKDSNDHHKQEEEEEGAYILHSAVIF